MAESIRERGLLPEGGDQSRSAAHALEGTAGCFAQVPKVLGTDVRQFVVLAVSPDVLHRIQFRRVGRQVLDDQTAFLVTDELLRDFAAVGRSRSQINRMSPSMQRSKCLRNSMICSDLIACSKISK